MERAISQYELRYSSLGGMFPVGRGDEPHCAQKGSPASHLQVMPTATPSPLPAADRTH